MKAKIAALLLPLALAAPAAAAPRFKKVVLVIFENTTYDQALAQPFFAALAKQGALLSNYYAVAHPSQPNYIALVSGSRQGVPESELRGDWNVNLKRRHLGDLLEAAQRDWKVYAQGYPGSCAKAMKSSVGRYARKHVPFISFVNVQKDPKRCAKIVDAATFASDAASGSLPDFSLYIPDLDNDGHDTGVPYADRWFSGAFGELVKNPAFTKGVLLVATFDEDDYKKDNRVYAALVGDGVTPGFISQRRYDHYSLLRTIEDNFALGTLGLNDDGAAAITDVWK